MHSSRAKKNSQILHAQQFFLLLFAVHLCHHSLGIFQLRGCIHTQLATRNVNLMFLFHMHPSHPRNVKRGNENYKFYWNKKTLKVVFMFCLERKNINGT